MNVLHQLKKLWSTKGHKNEINTVMFLSYQTYRSRQTVQTQFRLLQEEQSGQGFHVFVLFAIPDYAL